jgi:hypothetical protein
MEAQTIILPFHVEKSRGIMTHRTLVWSFRQGLFHQEEGHLIWPAGDSMRSRTGVSGRDIYHLFPGVYGLIIKEITTGDLLDDHKCRFRLLRVSEPPLLPTQEDWPCPRPNAVGQYAGQLCHCLVDNNEETEVETV